MGTWRTTGLVILVCAAGACAAKKVDSADLRTQGLGASFRVEAPGDQKARVYGWVTAGSPTNKASPLVELSSGDRLTLTSGGTTTALRLDKDFFTGAPMYVADFAEPPPGTSVDIALLRQSDISAPKSSCTMPQTFEVLSPVKGGAVTFGQELVVQWNNPSGTDEMTVSIDSECAAVLPTIQVKDTGTLTIGRDAVKLNAGCSAACRPPAKSCNAILRIGKAATGALDPAFAKGGSVKCVQARSVALTMNVDAGAAPNDAGADAR
jgi:hypothetical protein